MSKRTKDPIIMLDPLAVVRTFQMPDHPPQNSGKKRDGTTSMFLKHTNLMHMETDYKILRLVGQPMLKSEFISKLAGFISSNRSYGQRGGGNYAHYQAQRVVSAMIKEKHIVVF